MADPLSASVAGGASGRKKTRVNESTTHQQLDAERRLTFGTPFFVTLGTTGKELAKELHDQLESRGVSVWFSEKDVLLGRPSSPS